MKRNHFTSTLCLVLSISSVLYPLGFPEDKKVYEYALYGATFFGLTTGLYSWAVKKNIEKNYAALVKKYQHQAYLQDRYQEALSRVSRHKEFSDVFTQGTAEEQAQKICSILTSRYAKNQSLLYQLKKDVQEELSDILRKKSELDQRVTEWNESKKKTLLVAQTPHILKTYAHACEILEALRTHIPYIESSFFIQKYGPLLKDEQEFSQHLSEPEKLPFLISQLVRSKTRIGERYPYRYYTRTLELHHDYLSLLEQELTQHSYFPFQEQTITSIKTLTASLEGLKKYLKTSKEFEAECTQFDAEVLAVAHEKEAKSLKQKLSALEQDTLEHKAA